MGYMSINDKHDDHDDDDHWLLYKKLIKSKVPLFIVRILIVWYSLQRMHIR